MKKEAILKKIEKIKKTITRRENSLIKNRKTLSDLQKKLEGA